MSWVFGIRFDVDVQELVYAEVPRGIRYRYTAFITLLLLVAAGAVLLWTERAVQRFAIALNIFIVVDHLAWRYLIWFLKEVICTSQNTYIQEERYYDLEKLNIVTYQIQGNWKW
jgi:hypothetical protein